MIQIRKTEFCLGPLCCWRGVVQVRGASWHRSINIDSNEFWIYARRAEGSLRGLKKLLVVQDECGGFDKRPAAQRPVSPEPQNNGPPGFFCFILDPFWSVGRERAIWRIRLEHSTNLFAVFKCRLDANRLNEVSYFLPVLLQTPASKAASAAADGCSGAS